MSAIITHPGRAAGTRRQLPYPIGHQFHADLLCYRRNIQSVVFTILLPVLFLVLLASIFRNTLATVPGGTIKESVYYVPGLIAYGLITAAFSNLALSVVRNRESGIYKRRRATPLPASAVIASRAAIAVLTALAITVVMLGIGWAAYGASIPGRTAPAFVLDIIVGAVVFCCLGFAMASIIGNVDAVQPLVWATILPLSFISGIFIPTAVLPRWPRRRTRQARPAAAGAAGWCRRGGHRVLRLGRDRRAVGRPALAQSGPAAGGWRDPGPGAPHDLARARRARRGGRPGRVPAGRVAGELGRTLAWLILPWQRAGRPAARVAPLPWVLPCYVV
jgi:ABC-2 type transport system permease protein